MVFKCFIFFICVYLYTVHFVYSCMNGTVYDVKMKTLSHGK